jgi:hypothetical protein
MDVRNKSPMREVDLVMKKMFSLGAVSAISGLLWAQLVQPAPLVRQTPAEVSILTGANADAHVVSLVERSCRNCHSLKTEWPAYSRIFPLSRLIEHDVQAARTHMNLSRWQIYDNTEKSLLLSEIGSVVRNHEMPPRRYTLVHPDAKLSDEEANEIYQWTRAERRRLNRE